jgi:hypothetical protein
MFLRITSPPCLCAHSLPLMEMQSSLTNCLGIFANQFPLNDFFTLLLNVNHASMKISYSIFVQYLTGYCPFFHDFFLFFLWPFWRRIFLTKLSWQNFHERNVLCRSLQSENLRTTWIIFLVKFPAVYGRYNISGTEIKFTA